MEKEPMMGWVRRFWLWLYRGKPTMPLGPFENRILGQWTAADDYEFLEHLYKERRKG